MLIFNWQTSFPIQIFPIVLLGNAMYLMKRTLPLIFFLLLTACGGGEDNKTLMSGIFLDSPVEGLIYKTASQQGYTNEKGEFFFQQGETVSFYLGNIILGSAVGNSILTPLDLFHSQENKTHIPARNLVRFLQTLDTDNNPKNGIKLDSELLTTVSIKSIAFDQPIEAFEKDPRVVEILSTVTNNRPLVAEGKSYLHFQKSLSQQNLVNENEQTYHISGSITGLQGNLTIDNYNLDEVTVSDARRFSLPTSIFKGSKYQISITKQPTGQNCRVLNGKGEVANIDVSSVAIICETDEELIRGNVAGLASELIIAADDQIILIAANGEFNAGLHKMPENVVIVSQPEKQRCNVVPANQEIDIRCTNDIYSLSGSVENLSSPLVLHETESNQTITFNNNFTFPELFPPNDSFNLIIPEQPTGKTCVINTPAGYFSESDINSIKINCVDKIYELKIHVAGIQDNISVTINGQPVDNREIGLYVTEFVHGSPFDVRVVSNTDTKTCKLDEQVTENYASSEAIIDNQDIYFSCLNKAHSLYFKIDNYISDIAVSEIINNVNQPLTTLSDKITVIPAIPGKTYELTLVDPVIGQTCKIIPSVLTANTLLTTINIQCVNNKYPLRLSIDNLVGQLSIHNTLSAVTDNYSVSMANPEISLPYNTAYDFVVIPESLNNQSCTITNSQGTVPASIVDNIQISCVANAAELEIVIDAPVDHVSLAITEDTLAGSNKNIVTYNNSGSFIYPSRFYTDYQVAIAEEQTPLAPSEYDCFIVGINTGRIDQLHNGPVNVSCLAKQYWINFSVQNLSGDLQIVDMSNASQPITISQNLAPGSDFVKSLKFNRDTAYNFEVSQQPVGQQCNISGNNPIPSLNGDVSGVNIQCVDKYSVSANVSGMINVLQPPVNLLISYTDPDNKVSEIALSGDGNFSLTDSLLSTAVTNQTPIIFSITDPYAQECSFVLGNAQSKQLIISSLLQNKQIEINCHPKLYDLNLTLLNAKNTLGENISLNYNGNTSLLENGEAFLSFPGVLQYNQLTAVDIINSPINQHCRFSNYSQSLSIDFSGNQSVDETITCYDILNVTANTTGVIPDGLKITLNYTDFQNNTFQEDVFPTSANNILAFSNKLDDGYQYNFSTNNALCSVIDITQSVQTNTVTANVDCIAGDLITMNNLDMISDPALKSCILALPNAANTRISELTSLRCDGPYDVNGVLTDIHTIKGLRIFTSLVSVEFHNTAIEDFQELRYLPLMRNETSQLLINNNRYPSLADLNAWLEMSDNLKSCINSIYTDDPLLANTKQLISSISDIRYLICDGRLITDPANKISNINGLEKLHNLKIIYLPNQTLTDILPIAKLNIIPGKYQADVYELILANNDIGNISYIDPENSQRIGIEDLNSLRIVDLRNNKIVDAVFLEKYTTAGFSLNQLNLLNLSGGSNMSPAWNVIKGFNDSIRYYQDNDAILNTQMPVNDILINDATLRADNKDTAASSLVVSESNNFRKVYRFPLNINDELVAYHNLKFSYRFLPQKNNYYISIITPENQVIALENFQGIDAPWGAIITRKYDGSLPAINTLAGKVIDSNMNPVVTNQWQFQVIVTIGVNQASINNWENVRARMTYGTKLP